MFSRKVWLCILSCVSIFQLYAADNQKLITINGISRSMLEHIWDACFSSEKNPFRRTDIFTYDKNNDFSQVGTVCMVDQLYLKEIEVDNYIYVPKYKTTQTKRSKKLEDVDFGAIIVGTTDEAILVKFLNTDFSSLSKQE